jgi:hypothetical protein
MFLRKVAKANGIEVAQKLLLPNLVHLKKSVLVWLQYFAWVVLFCLWVLNASGC